MEERRDGLLNFHAGVIFQKGRVHDDGDDKSISKGDAVSVGCWKNEKTRNRIPLLMELMDTRVFEVLTLEGLLQCQRQVLDSLDASINFGILPRLASIPAISKTPPDSLAHLCPYANIS